MAAYKKKGISPRGFDQGTFFEFVRRRQYQMLTSAVLAIKAGGGVLVKGTEPFSALVGDTLVTKADNTDMAALSGTVLTATFNIFVFYIDAAGTLTSAMGTAGATLAAVIPPVTPTAATAIGMILVNPTGTGSFVGGTTALDDGTVIPGIVYHNFVGHIDLNFKRDLLASAG